MNTTTHTCTVCKQTKTYTGLGSGYGEDSEGNKVCYECCGKQDKEWMQKEGKILLYLTTEPAWKGAGYGTAYISNWPDSLKFTGRYRRGRHNIARYQYNVKFTGPDGFIWTGRTVGDMTQVCHCRRTKQKA